MNDGELDSSVATVLVTIAPVNDAPVAADDAYDVDENCALTTTVVNGVLSNDADPEGAMLTAILITAPSHGALTLNPDGSFAYTPEANYDGTDTFTYQAYDGEKNSNVATVHITINPISAGNHVPVIVSTAFPMVPVPIGQPVTVSATLTDADVTDVHQATWELGDGRVTPGVVTEVGGSG